MSEATRDKKQDWLEGLQFVNDCRPKFLIETMLARHGLSWLTDEQIDDLTSEAVSTLRERHRRNRKNRRFYDAMRKAESEAA